MSYQLISVKGAKTVEGDLAAAIRAAIAMEDDLQPAYGVTIEGNGRTFECRDGRVAVYAEAGDDSEDGHVMIEGDELVIAWEQGIRTPFADTGLVAG